jgi:hypothetical protein
MSSLSLYKPFAYAALTLGLIDQVTFATLKIYKVSRSSLILAHKLFGKAA